MNPHGCDLLDSSDFGASTEDLLSILVRLRELWPDAVMETDTLASTPLGEVTLEHIPTTPLREVFVYRTQTACDAWDAKGWTEKFDGDMIHVIALDTSLNLLVGDKITVEMSLWASRLGGDLKVLAASRQPPSA